MARVTGKIGLFLSATCGHTSSCRYCRCSASPIFADYAIGMPKARSHKPIARDGGQRNKTASDARNEIALTAESALPPKKPPFGERWRA
jgi:hypothetical protein